MQKQFAGWISRAGERWRARFPRCESNPCLRQRSLWGRTSSRRGFWLQEAWFCSERCFENAIRAHFVRVRLPLRCPPNLQHRIPLGLLLLSRGQLTELQLRAALKVQHAQGGRLGYWAEALGFTTEAQITAALGLQWACPVLPGLEHESRCAGMVPFHLQKKFRMLPVQFLAHTRVLHVAFSDGIEYAALFGIQQVLGCRTEPCLLGRRMMEQGLERAASHQRAEEMLFEGCGDPAGMARVVCSYLLQTESRKARVAACGDCVWVRLESGHDNTHLLFPRPGSAADNDHEKPTPLLVLPKAAVAR